MASSELMRTSLYAGGTSPVKMIQAGFYNEDCIVYDLEDSVSAGEKDAARFLVYNLVKYQRPKNKYVVVRVNGLYSEYLDEDLEAIVRAQPDAIRLPKVEYAKEVERIDQRVTQIEQAAGLPVGGIKLWCNIESYLGVMNAQEIAKASPRVGHGHRRRGPDRQPGRPAHQARLGDLLCPQRHPHGLPGRRDLRQGRRVL